MRNATGTAHGTLSAWPDPPLQATANTGPRLSAGLVSSWSTARTTAVPGNHPPAGRVANVPLALS
jgi:hypothetical protein